MPKRNAQQELLSAMVQGDKMSPDHKLPAYGRVTYESYHNDRQIEFSFRSLHEFNEGIAKLDFEYDAGFGGQELYGTVVFADGTWLTRGEYDGSEWWEYHCCPTISQVFPEENV